MKKLILILLTLLIVVGCRSRTNSKQKETLKSEIQVVEEVQVQVKETIKKDSTIKVDRVVKEVDTGVKVKIEFDPKKHDSLEVKQQVGEDIINLKIKGNGVVIFEYEKKAKEKEENNSTILGSQTLYNIDSTNNSRAGISINNKATRKETDTKTTGFDFGTYIIIGICAVVLLILWFLWMKFGNRLTSWFNNRKNN